MSNMSKLDTNIRAIKRVLRNHKMSIETGIGECWDDCDPWGSAMAEGFALCDWLYFDRFRSDLIPDSLDYRHGCGAEEDGMLLSCVREAYPEPSDDDAQHVSGYLQILSDFLDLCRAGGLDY